MEYKLLKMWDEHSVEYHVNVLLGEGWRLHGPTQAVMTDSEGLVYIQAMVRQEIELAMEPGVVTVDEVMDRVSRVPLKEPE